MPLMEQNHENEIEIPKNNYYSIVRKLLMTISPPCQKDDKISTISNPRRSHPEYTFSWADVRRDAAIQALIDSRRKAKAARKINGDTAR